MQPELATALRLQELDLQAAALRHEIADLPRQVAQIERLLEGHRKQLDLDKANLAANLRDRKRLDGDVQTQQQRISKLRDQMMQAKTNEQYHTFQQEIAYCEKEIRKYEDQILDLMTASEPLEAKVKQAESALADEKKVVAGKQEEARTRTAQDQAELKRLLEERKALTVSLPASLLRKYEHLRSKDRHGVAIAEVKDGHCVACNMMLRPQLFQELKSGEDVIACENCRRILYFIPPPVDVAAEMQV